MVLLLGLLVVCEAKKKEGFQEDFEFVEVSGRNVPSSIFPARRREGGSLASVVRWLGWARLSSLLSHSSYIQVIQAVCNELSIPLGRGIR